MFALFCVSLGMPLKPDLINTVCAFICYCIDERQFKPAFIRSLGAGVEFNIKCYDPSYPSLFSNMAVKLLLKGIAKASPQLPDQRQPITLPLLHRIVTVLREAVFPLH